MKRRIHFLVKKRMQFALTLRFLVLMVVFTLFIGFETYMIIWPVAAAYIPGSFIDLVTYQVMFRFLAFSIPVLFVLTAFAVIFTHRIAGPLSRLERTLDELLEGKQVDPIRLRKHDELQELTSKINKLIPLMKSRSDFM
jgi:signal transduction histidine kinase